MIEYPKPIMKTAELRKMGFPLDYLEIAYRSQGQTFCHKMNPLKPNSSIVFDTAGFEAWRQKQIRAENQAVAGRR